MIMETKQESIERKMQDCPEWAMKILYVKEYSEEEVSDICHGIKDGEQESIEKAAQEMYLLMRDGDVIVGMPSHTGKADMRLAEAIGAEAEKNGLKVTVMDALEADERESLYDMKVNGDELPLPSQLGFRVKDDVKEQMTGGPDRVVIVDNVLATGTTAQAALDKIPYAQIIVYARDTEVEMIPWEGDMKITTETHDGEEVKFKTVRKVKIKEFEMDRIELVPYDEKIIGDDDEVTYENYLNLHGKMYPDIFDAMKDEVHTMKEAKEYITGYVKGKLAKSRRAVPVSSNTVFALLTNYYNSPVVEEQVKIEPKKPASSYTPTYKPETEEERAERLRKQAEAEEERKRKIAEEKEKARIEKLQKEQEEKNKMFAGSLFGF